MKYKEAEKILKVNRATIYRYVKTGKLRVTQISEHRYNYNDDDVFKLAGLTEERKAVIYARVSTTKQQKDLENQISTIRQYANSIGYKIDKVYSDIASGMSYDRCEFKSLLSDVLSFKIKTIVISNKDRFSRISFNMWKELFESYNCNIIVMNDDIDSSESAEKEIFEDIISLIHCFAMKMCSKRRKNKLKMIKENLEVEL